MRRHFSWRLWAWSWIAMWIGVGRYRAYRLYDALMIRFWPYGVFPGEWKDLVFGPSENNEEREKRKET